MPPGPDTTARLGTVDAAPTRSTDRAHALRADIQWLRGLAVLAVLGAELDIVVQGQAGNLDELRRERAQTPAPRAASAADAPSTFNKTGSR